MKNKIIKMILPILLFCCLLPTSIKASSGYYYESINVQVEVNEAREYQITETLDIFYEEEMHGIIRSIPDSSDVEGYYIDDVYVEGANYEVEESGAGVDIRIGDADKYVSGNQRYVVHYTLKHYQDYDQKKDYLYLNVIGDDFDCRIEKMSANIKWPASMQQEEVKITSGSYGSTNNNKIRYEVKDNEINMETRYPLRAYEAVTLQVVFPQGSFSQAPLYPFPYQVDKKEVHLSFNEEQDIQVVQRYEITSNSSYSSFLMNKEMDMYPDDRLEIENYECLIDGKENESKYSIRMSGEGSHVVEMKYTIHPHKLLDGSYTFELIDTREDVQTHSFLLALKMPKKIHYQVDIGRKSDISDTSRYSVKEEEGTLYLEVNDVLQPAEHLTLTLDIREEDFNRPIPIIIYVMVILSLVLAAITLFVKLFAAKNKYVELIQFYPPRGLNSAELGYLIDHKLSNEDMTSLIFYWAGKHVLKIHGVDKNFVLEKVSELPATSPFYERELFEGMFRRGNEGRVTAKNLKKKFYVDIDKAKDAIKEKYETVMPMYDTSVEKYKKLFMVLAVILFVSMMLVMSAYDSMGLGVMAIVLASSALPIIIVEVIMIISAKISKQKVHSGVQYILLTCMGIPLLILSFVEMIFSGLYIIPYFIVLVSCTFTFIVALTIKKYNKETTKLIGEIRGFKRFLKEAEKKELEMLLEENPEYYYHILPYAQVLHVSKIWTKKFKEITMQPPNYMDRTMDCATFYSCSKVISRTMKRSINPPASSGGHSGGSRSSGFSGRGGSFSGGGHSGGGSGGGGSRGW